VCQSQRMSNIWTSSHRMVEKVAGDHQRDKRPSVAVVQPVPTD
jgi:hypothetical protein